MPVPSDPEPGGLWSVPEVNPSVNRELASPAPSSSPGADTEPATGSLTGVLEPVTVVVPAVAEGGLQQEQVSGGLQEGIDNDRSDDLGAQLPESI